MSIAALVALSLSTVPPDLGEAPRPAFALDFSTPFSFNAQTQLLPGAHSMAFVLEQVALPSLVHNESGSGELRLSSFGGSWQSTRWHFGPHDTTDPLASGRPSFRPPPTVLGQLSLHFDEAVDVVGRGGVRFELSERSGHTMGVQSVLPGLGGPIFFARPFVDATSGEHALDRQPPPPENRPQALWALNTWAAGSERWRSKQLRYATWVSLGADQALDFGHRAGARVEKTTADRAGTWMELHAPDWVAHAGLQLEGQSHDLLDRRFAVDQSATRRAVAVSTGLTTSNSMVHLLLSHRTRTPRQRDFVLDAQDVDGESLEPFYADGASVGLRLEAQHERGPFFISTQQDVLHHRPETQTWSHPLSYQGRDFGAWALKSRASSQLRGESRLGVRHGESLGPLELDVVLYLAQNHGVAVGSQNALLRVLPAGLVRLSAPHWPLQPFFTLARTPLSVTTQQLDLIDNKRLQAELRTADGRLLETRTADHIETELPTPPSIYSAVLGGRLNLGRSFRIDTVGLFRLYDGIPQLRLDGASSTDDVFYFDDGPTHYRLTSDPYRSMQFGLHMQLYGSGPGWHFAFGFSAYNAVGKSAFGNGAFANDALAVNYADANPNARHQELANLDGDRGFMLKTSAGFRLWRQLWASVALRFRDGQPSSFYQIEENEGQLARLRHSHRGSPLKVGRPLLGPREDFQLETHLKLLWAGEFVSGWLTLQNAFDMGNELQEVSGPAGIDGRAALEQQQPRALLFGLSFRP